MTNDKTKEVVLLFSTLLISISGLIYELLESTISSYFLGDSVYHFSIIIGLFMSSMGVGSWFSRYINGDLIKSFIYIQLLLALFGGFSGVILFFAFAVIKNYDAFLYLETIIIGSLLGAEIPLIIRILQNYLPLKNNISNVFTADYIGALFASLLFPLVILPKLGLLQGALLFGALNVFVAILAWYVFKDRLKNSVLLLTLLTSVIIVIGFVTVERFNTFMERRLYNDKIIYSKTTPYQHIVITRKNKRIKFYINGALQFDSLDEYRYHEMLIHPIMTLTKSHKRILILGGGDGLALREILKYKDVERVTLVDLDSTITNIFSSNPLLKELNRESLNSSKVEVVNLDAWKYIENSKELFDVIVIDLPDPNNVSLSRLYSREFFTMVKNHLSRFGAVVTQATSPLYSRKAFWSIEKTIKSTGLITLSYHTYIPSFGEWGFIIGFIKLEFNFSQYCQRRLSKVWYLEKELLSILQQFSQGIIGEEVKF